MQHSKRVPELVQEEARTAWRGGANLTSRILAIATIQPSAVCNGLTVFKELIGWLPAWVRVRSFPMWLRWEDQAGFGNLFRFG
jgi:hypothetical protein